jgi:hypothetical protein
MNLALIREALYSTLASGLPELTVHRTPVHSPAVPCLMIDTPTAGMRAETFEGYRPISFPLILLVSAVDPESSYDLLDRYLSSEGPESIEELLGEDHTLGGIVGSCTVTEYGLVDPRRAVGVDYLAVEVIVEVWA